MSSELFFLIIASVILFFLLSKNVLSIVFNLDKIKTYKSRMNQLTSTYKKNPNDSKEFINKVTNPILSLISPNLNQNKMDVMEKNLKLIGWDKTITAQQFTAIVMLGRIIGIALLLFFTVVDAIFIGIIWFIALSVLPKIFYNNSVKNKKEQIFNEFPTFVRSTQGYLMSNIPFIDSIEKVSMYAGKGWQPILDNFLVTSRVKSPTDAIQEIRDNIDIFEVRELFSLINLSIEQGTDVKESFEREIQKIKEIQELVYESKLAKRQIFGQLLQGPLILTLFVAFGLPIFSSMFTAF